MIELGVNISQNNINYPIKIVSNDVNNFMNSVISSIQDNNYIVVISSKVYHLYSKVLNLSKDKLYILKDGEIQKNYKNYLKIMNFAFSKNLKRGDYIIAIGGGVVGDIAGFVASTYMRGINFIQVPTTLLAATDSSVGGKVAINNDYGKNLVGAFYQPKAVYININFLKTLDDIQYKSGLGEVIKYGFIEKSCQSNEDVQLLNYLTENYNKILERDVLILEQLVKKCIQLKISVVEKDEKESGLRKILNYGHTYGHALEVITNYKKYTHGQCVIEGIKFATALANKLEMIDKEYKFITEDLLNKFDYKNLNKYNFKKLVKIMTTDKKATSKYIKFILPIEYGKVTEKSFTTEELLSFGAQL